MRPYAEHMSANVSLTGVGPADMCLPAVAAQLTSSLDAALGECDRDRMRAVLVAARPLAHLLISFM